MKAARLENSERLQTLLLALQMHPAGLTTMELIQRTGSVAPHSDVSELRANGVPVDARQERCTAKGRRVWRYRLGRVA